ncbi:bcl-2-associated transcription factor 1 isoform X2 [Lepisosteus oculatus]|uniref:bcl-2-associated transcription factor 1 isoform X2 n=1 Tax=Lepisosteus oculatus TaxID=7918 RepID=UPI0003EAB091|nr:PREDICTED: bcl-2-associated transcription factor 1 isoform X2 [Lepisosteus oculatus]
MVRSNSRSHTSRSRSGSHSSSRSRSRSRSRKKRYSSRSRTRSYSRSRSRERERIYPRDYRRDYRMNRGMRRPYGFRGRGRGFYQGGGRFHHRGGFRPNWQNRRYSRSPRRVRSRSRSPKRRSTSQRSRSKSHHSARSSASRRSSSSRSSSLYSRSPAPAKSRGSQDKASKKSEGGKEEGSGRQLEEEKGDGKAEQPAIATSAKSDLKRTPAVITESWIGISAYNDTSPHRSPSPIPTPPSQSSSRSDTAAHQVASKISPPSLPALRLHSLQHSPDDPLGHYSPSHDSPPYQTSPRRSPAKAFSTVQSSRGFFPNSDEQDLPKVGKYLKRYTEEDGGRAYLHERGNGRDKEHQKDRLQEKGRGEGDWGDQGGIDPGVKKESEKVPFLGDSPDPEEDESQAYRQPYQFKVTTQAEQVKNYPVESRWNVESQEEGSKYKIKTSKGERDYERFGEDRMFKFKNPGYMLDRLNKDKYGEEGKGTDKYDERITIKRETVSPQQAKAERFRELFDQSPLLQKTLDMREKAALRDESPPRVKIVPGEASRPEVKVKIASLAYDDPSPGTSLTSDRSLASALVHSTKREQGFRSIFDHIKRPQAYKNSAESFIQHIVSLVHHVKEHYFKSTGMSLHERFTAYQKAAEGHEVRQKSPEIHRRIDISPSAFRKDRILKEDSHKGEKKSRCDAADLRHDIDRRRKERSRDRDDSRGSREPSPSRKLDKLGKEFKDYKDYKSYKDDSKHKSKERERSRSSSSSSLSREDNKDSRKERDEEYKSHHEQKDYVGYQGGNRARGTFQFRIRGSRGRGRGVFSGPNPGPSVPNIPFQKRPKEEEWDPEYTPKSKKYFLHDDRDDGVDYWAKRGRGRGIFQRGRGRFSFKKSSSSPKWTHDKYQCEGNVEDDDDDVENDEERKDKRKDEKE